MAALRMLPADQQAALVLVDMLGYPVADAAEVLGVSAGTVKSRCSRGRARLVPHLAHLRQPRGSDPAARQRRNRSGTASVEPSQEGGNDQL
jgi:RNA polymerase sigma-70 factor (ECF subfamily)